MPNSSSDAPANANKLEIKTGVEGCYAYFYPGVYQLTLIKDDAESRVELGYSGSRLLERLLQTPGEVVTREELIAYAWPGRVVGQGSLNQQIYTLRQTLSDETSRDIIQTLPRRGYQFNAHFLVAQAPGMAATTDTRTIAKVGQVTPLSHQHADTIAPPVNATAELVTQRTDESSEGNDGDQRFESPAPTALLGLIPEQVRRFAPVSFFVLGLLTFVAAGVLYNCEPPERCYNADNRWPGDPLAQ